MSNSIVDLIHFRSQPAKDLDTADRTESMHSIGTAKSKASCQIQKNAFAQCIHANNKSAFQESRIPNSSK